MSTTVAFTLDGKPASARAGESILKAAQRHGMDIPHLCFSDGLRADGNCRACVVEIDGERSLAPSCCRSVTSGMRVQANSARARKSQAMVVEMLLSDMPDQGHRWHDGGDTSGAAALEDAPGSSYASSKSSPGASPSTAGSGASTAIGQHGELSAWAARMGVSVRPALRALRRTPPPADLSHPAMAVNLDACIQCKRCVRACRESQVNDVIGYARRGAHSAIVFDLDAAMGDSSCVACGECVQACPTGALMPKTQLGSQAVDRRVDSVCPFCGVGCLLTYNVRGNTIVSVDGRDGPANHKRLCVKGRFGLDYVHSPQRLTVPLIRKSGVPKDPALLPQLNRDSAHWSAVFREATWDEALALAGATLKGLRDRHGHKALAGFGSAKGSNEEAYLFQKLVRTGFGSNNVDHCTRLCHASSVAALLEGVGSAAVSNQVNDVAQSELIFVIGANPSANHPVAATWIKNAAKRGAKIVLADPRVTDLGQHAWRTLQFKADTDVAMLNALIHTVIDEGLADQAFIRSRTSNFEALRENVKGYSPEAMAPICGIAPATLREVARAFAKAKGAMILWGMGISQHVHGTDNARCLIALAAVTGQIGKPGSGLHPLRGQNNVQGASDAGLIPMMFPNYQRVTDPAAHQWFEHFWGMRSSPGRPKTSDTPAGGSAAHAMASVGAPTSSPGRPKTSDTPAGGSAAHAMASVGAPTSLDDQPGYTVVEILHKALSDDSDPHKVRGMYIMGENPAMSDPDLNHARHALASLAHLVVQDIFMTETAWLADVVLPASAWPEKTGSVSNTDRMVQLGRQAIDPPGQAKPDLWIIQQIAKSLDLSWDYPGEHCGVAAVYEEMRQALHATIAGITWERLQRESSVTYPCLSADDPGAATVFMDRFATEDGRLHLVPADLIAANERPDAEYAWVLITGRQLEHWHTGSMTRRARVLDALEPIATASLCGADLLALGLEPGDLITVQSRRGRVVIHVRRDDGTPRGAVFIPFAYHEAAANLMTNAALDPFGKIPEFKYCAVAIRKGGEPAQHIGYAPQ